MSWRFVVLGIARDSVGKEYFLLGWSWSTLLRDFRHAPSRQLDVLDSLAAELKGACSCGSFCSQSGCRDFQSKLNLFISVALRERIDTYTIDQYGRMGMLPLTSR